MLIQTLQTLFKRDLTSLKREINAYHNEAVIWSSDQQINNSAGNLCLHLLAIVAMTIIGLLIPMLKKDRVIRNVT